MSFIIRVKCEDPQSLSHIIYQVNEAGGIIEGVDVCESVQPVRKPTRKRTHRGTVPADKSEFPLARTGWSAEELSILQRLIVEYDDREWLASTGSEAVRQKIMSQLPGRTWPGIYAQRYKLLGRKNPDHT